LVFLNPHAHPFKEKVKLRWRSCWVTKHIVQCFGHLSFSRRNFSFLDSVCSTEAFTLLVITPSLHYLLSLHYQVQNIPLFFVVCEFRRQFQNHGLH
jgi:hypothetical protein